MGNGGAMRADDAAVQSVDAQRQLFDRIAAFLERNRLGADPVNYEFAYRVHKDPAGPLAKAVEALTEGGIRLTRRDIVALGGQVGTEPAPEPRDPGSDILVAKTQMQVEGFQDLMCSMRAETQGFGRDLAASARAIELSARDFDTSRVVRITTEMLNRVQSAEQQLEHATREAIELRQKLEEARDNARRDPLTGLPNRRALEEGFADKMAANAAVCIAVCDIDRFKAVNDGFGHAVGDRVLKAIADVLADHCEGQLVARYGGEEFAVLFADVELCAAQKLLDNARLVVAGKRYRLRETDVPLGEVTFSAGLSAVRPDESFSDAFVRADRLLYAAKADGRNCVKTG